MDARTVRPSRRSSVAARLSAFSALILAVSVAAAMLDSCAGSPKPGAPSAPPAETKPQGKTAKPLTPEEKKVQAVEAAAAMLDSGDATQAAEKLAQAAEAAPKDSELRLAQAAALVSAGKLGEARAAVDELLKTEPANVHALSMAAQLAHFDGDENARKAYLDKALAASPSDASVLSAWGDYCLDAKAWPKAEDFYRRAQASDAKSVDAALGLGRALYREAKYPEAEAQLTQAIALEPKSPLAYSDRSRAYYQQGKYKESEADLDTAISLSPDASWLYLDRGRYRLDKNDLAGAKADFDRAIALEPDYFLSYAYRGGILEEQGDDEAAIADYRKVIELYPDYWYAFESAGAAAFRLGLWAESAQDFQKAYKASPDRYEYAIAGALALWRSGKPKEASSFAGSIAPSIDRDKNGIYWNMLRLIQDQNNASAELELKIQAEKKLDIKGAMLFYLSEYWLCKGRTELATKYLALCEDMKREGTLEYRMLLAEKKRLEAAAK